MLSDCKPWTGRLDPDGYGRTSTSQLAHRIAYEAARGPIPDGLQLDHTCANRACVNPSHLEPVTAAENVRRARERLGEWRRQGITRCIHGHPFDAANTYQRPDGDRGCRACIRKRSAEYRARKKASA